MADLTTEDIQQAREHARRAVANPDSRWSRDRDLLLARAFLAVFEQNAELDAALQEWTEQQPEPVSEGEFAAELYKVDYVYHGSYQHLGIRDFLSRYTITRKPQDGA